MSRRSIQLRSRQRTRSTGTGASVHGAGSATGAAPSAGLGPLPRKARTEALGSTRLSISTSSSAMTRCSSGASLSRSVTRCRVMGRGCSVATSDSTSMGIGSSDQCAPPTFSGTPKRCSKPPAIFAATSSSVGSFERTTSTRTPAPSTKAAAMPMSQRRTGCFIDPS